MELSSMIIKRFPGECAPHPPEPRVRVRVGRSPNSDDWKKKLSAMSTLCCFP